MFALELTLCELEYGSAPYAELDGVSITNRFAAGDSPSVFDFILGCIIVVMLGRQIPSVGGDVRRRTTTVWTVIKGVILVIGGLSIQTHTEVGPTSFATVLEKHPS